MSEEKRKRGRPRKPDGEKADRSKDRHKARKPVWVSPRLYEELDRIAWYEKRPTTWQGEIALQEHIAAAVKSRSLPPLAEDEAWREEKRRREDGGESEAD